MPRFARESRTIRPMPVTKTASGASAADPRPSLRFDFAFRSGNTNLLHRRNYNSCNIMHVAGRRQALSRRWAPRPPCPLPSSDRIVGRNNVKAVDLPALRGHIGLAGVDEIVELLRVEIGMLRIGTQVGLDDQHHPERMRKEPAFMRDVCALGVRMLNWHEADLSWATQYARSWSVRPRGKHWAEGITRSRWPTRFRAWTSQPSAAAHSPRRRARRRSGRVR